MAEESKLDFDVLADAIYENKGRIDDAEKELAALKLKFKTFFKIYLETLPPEKAQEIFKRYQQESFRK